MKSFKQLLGGNLRQFTMLAVLVVIVAFFQWKTGGKVLSPINLMNVINGYAYVLTLAIGMILVIVIGQIDLSVGAVASVVGIVTATAVTNWGWPWWVGILAGLAVGVVIGCWQGFWVSRIGVPGFITTLAGMWIFRGAGLMLAAGASIPVPTEIQFLGSGYLFPAWRTPAMGSVPPLSITTLLIGAAGLVFIVWSEIGRRRKARAAFAEVSPAWVSIVRVVVLGAVICWITYQFASGPARTSFPMAGLILVVLIIIYHVISQHTTFGRHVYAVGGNRAAAALSGVNVKRTYFLVFLSMSVLSAIAGIMFVGRSTSSGLSDGTGWELDAIAAVFIGGAAVSGGIGTVVGTVIGALVMAFLNNGLSILGVDANLTLVIKGLVLLAAVAFDVWNKTQGRPSIIGRVMGSRKKSEEVVVEPGPVNPQVAAVNDTV